MASYKISRGINFSFVSGADEITAIGTKGRKKFGWCGPLRLAQLCGFKYVGMVIDQVWGDFTSLEYRRIR